MCTVMPEKDPNVILGPQMQMSLAFSKTPETVVDQYGGGDDTDQFLVVTPQKKLTAEDRNRVVDAVKTATRAVGAENGMSSCSSSFTVRPPSNIILKVISSLDIVADDRSLPSSAHPPQLNDGICIIVRLGRRASTLDSDLPTCIYLYSLSQ